MKIKTLSVYEVTNYIKKVLDNDFIMNNLSVKGEISNLKIHSSGHIYFSLKDDLSKINCVMFKTNANSLDFELEEGMEIIVTGRASLYQANGSFQLYCNKIIKQGLGELHIQFERLKEKLAKAGYFSVEKKKHLPNNVERIGIVTSPTGAAIHDMLNVIRRRNKLVDILLFPAQVQGKDAYKSIISGINYFNMKKNVDVIIIGRGGGSIEELWNFNEEELAITIFNSNIPIVSAVGHEVDYTISDFVSDLRAATPSQAGELVVEVESDIINKIAYHKDNLDRILQNKFSVQKSMLDNYYRILTLNSPMNKIVNNYLEIENLKNKLNLLMDNIISCEKNKLTSMNNLLIANNPLNILGKGYAIITDEENNVLKNIGNFKEVQNIKIVLRDGFVKGSFKLVENGGNNNGKERKL